jgi:hypothetical protein
MNKSTIIIGLTLSTLLYGCASPAQQMTPQQVSMLANKQLCDLHNAYPWEQKTEMEIGRRNLNCDPAFNECLNQGNKPGTPAMGLCVSQLRQSWELQRQVQQQQRQIEQNNVQAQNQIMWDHIMENSRANQERNDRSRNEQRGSSSYSTTPRQQIITGTNGVIVQQY